MKQSQREKCLSLQNAMTKDLKKKKKNVDINALKFREQSMGLNLKE